MTASHRDICKWVVAAAPGGKLVSDSRQVEPGDVFFAYPGDAGDGRRFIAAPRSMPAPPPSSTTRRVSTGTRR